MGASSKLILIGVWTIDAQHDRLFLQAAAAYLCNHTSEETRSGALLALVQLLQNAMRNCRHWLGIAFPPVSRECSVPLEVITYQAFEDVVLKSPYSQPAVGDHTHQDHLCIARLTKHHT
jgi:hypothetical protein